MANGGHTQEGLLIYSGRGVGVWARDWKPVDRFFCEHVAFRQPNQYGGLPSSIHRERCSGILGVGRIVHSDILMAHFAERCRDWI